MVDVGDVLEDPRGRQRVVPMKVLCLGMGRNGTESLCTALTMLGIPTYHGWQTIANVRHNQLWYEAMLSKYKNRGKIWSATDFDQMLGRSSACTDNPAAYFAVELIEAYPEAKVILNRRPVKEWWASWERHILPFRESWTLWLLSHCDWECYKTLILWNRMQDFYFRHNSRRNGQQIYKEHCALVRGAARPDQYLEWEPRDGWEPLCKLLGVPIPNEPFPHTNQTEAFNRTVDGYLRPRLERAKRNLVVFSSILIGFLAYAKSRYYSA